jgi:histidinol dehydrogenase
MIDKSYTRNICLTQRLADLTQSQKQALFARGSLIEDSVTSATARIVDEVRAGGDAALIAMTRRFDGAELTTLEVPRSAWRDALASLDAGLIGAMRRTIRNLETVQRAFLPEPSEISPEPGIVVGRRPDPLDRAGIYAPGGRAAYPSSVLMGAVPARIAGVREIVLCSPPGVSGLPSAVVLAAAELAGVDRVFAVGGAGAIAAMAFGTESVPRVDTIVGPGNAYVAEAKLQVAGMVSIDSPAGPSELLVVADSSTNVDVLVREVMAQAEHDPRAVVIVVAVGQGVADSVSARLADALPSQQRRDIIEESLRTRGAVLCAADMDEAVEFSNNFAPEHLLLATDSARDVLPSFRNAGTVFVGERSSVAFGDYMTGANHVLPTGGLARSYSGLSVLDFIRWTTYQVIDADAARRLSDDVAIFAESEGLPAHAAAARQWSALAGSAS